MNSNKKDVNDYFKYLKLYYLELAKKLKKEREEKKKKEQETIRIVKKREEQLINRRRKVVKKRKIAIKTNDSLKDNKVNIKKEEKKVTIDNIKLQEIKKKQQAALINEKKKQEELKKKAEEKKKQEELKKKTEEKKKQEELKKKAEEKKKQEELKKKNEEKKKQEELKKKAEEKKKQEELKKKAEEKKKQDELKKKVEEEIKKKQQAALINKKKKEKELKNNSEEKKKDNDIKKKKQASTTKKTINNKDKDNENKVVKKEKNNENNKGKKDNKEKKDVKVVGKKKKDDTKKEEKSNNKKQDVKNDNKENNKKKDVDSNKKTEENKKEDKKKNTEKVKKETEKKKETKDNKKNIEDIGKKEFISTINKQIQKDYDSLHNLNMEIHRINQELEICKTESDFNKLINRANENKKNIESVISRLNMIKSGEIISIAFSLSKKQPKELKEYIDILKKDSSNYTYLKTLYPEFKYKLDYSDTISRINKNNTTLINNINEKKQSVNNINEKKEENVLDINKFNKKVFDFKNKLLKFQMSINGYSSKVKNIMPKKVIETKYYLGDKEIKGNLHLKQIAISLSNNPKYDMMTAEQIFNKLRSQLRVVTKESIVPSNNYRIDLLREKASLNLTRKDILSTLDEVREFKNEFREEFNDHLSSSEFYEYYSEIESIETKLKNEEEKGRLLNNDIDKAIIENDKRVEQINKMNKLNQQNNTVQNNNQQNNVQQNNVQQNNNQQKNNNIDYNTLYASMYRSEYVDEEEKKQGGPRM